MINRAKAKIVLLLLCCWLDTGFGNNYCTLIPSYSEKKYLQDISEIYHNKLPAHLTRCDKMAYFSTLFIGKPYLGGALGEGPAGQIDKSPLFRTDAFDCLTFVSTVLALSYASNATEFVTTMKKIQYKEGKVAFYTRNHFTEDDWNRGNESNHFVKDITAKIASQYIVANTYLDRASWFSHLTSDTVKMFQAISVQKSCYLIDTIRRYADTTRPTSCYITMIPLTILFNNDDGEIVANQAIFNRIPNGSIVEIVDKTINFKSKIGTDLGVVHLGIAIKIKNELLFRHASKVHQVVLDVPLTQYLKRYYLLTQKPNLVGIHVLGVE